jgi:hypothetical protein
VFIERFRDIAGYDLGYVFNVPGTGYGSIFTIVRYKTSKIMEAPRYITVIGIFGKEFVLSSERTNDRGNT